MLNEQRGNGGFRKYHWTCPRRTPWCPSFGQCSTNIYPFLSMILQSNESLASILTTKQCRLQRIQDCIKTLISPKKKRKKKSIILWTNLLDQSIVMPQNRSSSSEISGYWIHGGWRVDSGSTIEAAHGGCDDALRPGRVDVGGPALLPEDPICAETRQQTWKWWWNRTEIETRSKLKLET